MWRQVVEVTIVIIVLNILFAKSFADVAFEKYPYGLIGENLDGILNEDDLAANTCRFQALPFPQSDVYPYWQCYETKKVKFYCEDQGYFKEEKSHMWLLIFKANEEKLVSYYMSPRAWGTPTCRSDAKDWKLATRHQKYVCFSGSFMSEKQNVKGKAERNWIFGRYKTHKTCESYFADECSLEKQIKKGCKPVPLLK